MPALPFHINICLFLQLLSREVLQREGQRGEGYYRDPVVEEDAVGQGGEGDRYRLGANFSSLNSKPDLMFGFFLRGHQFADRFKDGVELSVVATLHLFEAAG